MITVWKYPLTPPVGGAKIALTMPSEAEVIHVEWMDGQAYLWAVVDTEKEKRDRFFEVHGTGWRIRNSGDWEVRGFVQCLKHRGSFVIPKEDADGLPLVFHVFEHMSTAAMMDSPPKAAP